MDRGDYFLSGYKLMWMMVMFDLPVSTKKERKEAGDFRIFRKRIIETFPQTGWLMVSFVTFHGMRARKSSSVSA